MGKARALKRALESFESGDMARLEQENSALKAKVAELESAQQTTHNVTLALVEAIVDDDSGEE